MIACGRGLYAVGGSDMQLAKSSRRAGSVRQIIRCNVCKAYEGGINGWSQCNCLKQGIRPRLMTLGRMMGLFTLLWWHGPGVIKNTNPLINLKSVGIETGIVRNNAGVFCRPLGFARLISVLPSLERESLPLCH